MKHPENELIIKPFFLFIDEPEICLHPQAQLKLLQALVELSKTKQIFIATHSPYFFDTKFLKNVALFLFAKDNKDGIKISNIKKENWGVLPWSPSWGEINYYAYNSPSVEFHNELYGYLQEKSGKKYISEFSKYLVDDKGIVGTKDYTHDGKTEKIPLCTYIRNQIHHPENTSNDKYTNEELKKSVELLIKAINE